MSLDGISPLQLFKTRRFWPLFITQFLGAFNDNVFKNALIILITYVVAAKAGMDAQVLVTLSAGLFILPFFLFSATAGQLADKHEMGRLIRYIKLAEILIMALAAIGFYLENVWLLLGVLFLMGTQSACFGPLKYSILPSHLEERELLAGNALIEAGTFLAILIGTITGGLLIMAEGGVALVSALVLAMAVLGWVVSWRIPHAGPSAPNLHVRWNFMAETWHIIRTTREQEDVFLSIIGISWFWFVGATFLAQFPTFAKEMLGGDETVVTLFLTLFSLGIGVGSMLCNALLKGEITGNLVPVGTFGMALFTVVLYVAARNVSPSVELMDAVAFMATPLHWVVILSLLLIAIFSGIYIVPLYAIMQSRSPKSHRARVVAGNNVMNALFMVGSVGFTLGMLAIGRDVADVFLVMAALNLPITWLVRKLVREQQAKRKAREATESNEGGGNAA